MHRHFVDRDVNRKPGLLDSVKGKVFHAGHDVLAHSCGKCCTHQADMNRILAVALLCTSPFWVAEHVSRDTTEEVGSLCTSLDADGPPDLFFERTVPAGATGRGDREACGSDR